MKYKEISRKYNSITEKYDAIEYPESILETCTFYVIVPLYDKNDLISKERITELESRIIKLPEDKVLSDWKVSLNETHP